MEHLESISNLKESINKILFKDYSLATLDLRDKNSFERLHFASSSNIPFIELEQRMNELPARPATLNIIVGKLDQATLLTEFFQQKGYVINQFKVEQELVSFLKTNPKFLATGKQKKNLWKPCKLLIEFVDMNIFSLDKLLAIDIACGGGRDAVFLSQLGWQVTAIEKQEQVISRAQQLAKNNHQHINCITCDVNNTDCLPNKKFNLVVIIRYLNRDLIGWIKNHVSLGGFVVFQAFSEGVEKFKSPKNAKVIINKEEFAKTFGKDDGFEIIIDRIDLLEDGRPVSSFIAKRV